RIELPESNVIKVFLQDGSWYCLRPSGTEPKIKCYFGVKAGTHEQAEASLRSLKEKTLAEIEKI
ncbi:MAG: phospho-sugar mutase, partial [Alkalicoccus sp.]